MPRSCARERAREEARHRSKMRSYPGASPWITTDSRTRHARRCRAALDVHCRRSSEIRFTEAAFSVAKIVLPRDLAMKGSERRRLASVFRRRKSPSVHRRFAVPSGTPSLDAFFFVESKLRRSARATVAADIFCFASTVSWRISFCVQARCFDRFDLAMTDPLPSKIRLPIGQNRCSHAPPFGCPRYVPPIVAAP